MRYMITLTDNTLAELRRRISPDACSPYLIRVGLEEGGCSGTTYQFALATESRPDDLTISQGEFTMVMEPRFQPLLEGLEIDFVDSLVGGGFRFKNPNADQSCGCGSSFRIPQGLQEL